MTRTGTKREITKYTVLEMLSNLGIEGVTERALAIINYALKRVEEKYEGPENIKELALKDPEKILLGRY